MAFFDKNNPQAGTSVADLPEGIYNLSSYGLVNLTDLPSDFPGGRSIIITTGTVASSERVIILANSRSAMIFLGTIYGSTLNWKKVNFTVA